MSSADKSYTYSQASLFTDNDLSTSVDSRPQFFEWDGASLVYFPQWVQSKKISIAVEALYQQLKEQVAWEQTEIMLYGKTIPIPRLNAWYGDAGCHYQYSGTHFSPLPWLPLIRELKQLIKRELLEVIGLSAQQSLLNSALINCYRHGQDSVAWHSDDEPELGKNPIVASLSLGGSRKFQLKHRYKPDIPREQFILNNGDLLLMYGETHHYWHHQIPKTRQTVSERINLTFRRIISL